MGMMLPKEFLERMKAQMGGEYEAFAGSYAQKPVRGLRVNTLKLPREGFQALSPWTLSPADTLEEGFVLEEDVQGIGAHPYHMAGLFYMQEPSAMAAIDALEVHPGMRVLDLCAAPGGKAGGIAARLAGEGLLVANDLSAQRARVLLENVQRLGVANAIVTNARPELFQTMLEGYFDAVLVDAPCSGEGMFRRDARAVEEWSLAHVFSCAQRQRLILQSAAACVRPGGTLVYATCTFSAEENEGVVEAFLQEHPEYALAFTRRLYPHQMRGEGQFVAKLIRDPEAPRGAEKHRAMRLSPCKDSGYAAFLRQGFERLPEGFAAQLMDGRVQLLTGADMIPQALGKIRILSAGVAVGEVGRGSFRPAHALALAQHGGKFATVLDFATDDPRLQAFLRGEPVAAQQGEKGWCVVCAGGYSLGLGKASGGVVKNHLPENVRVRQ